MLFLITTGFIKKCFFDMQLYNYETSSEAINDLIKRGYTTDYTIKTESECLLCVKTAKQLSPDEFEIVETYRFDGMTDPEDETVIYAISSKNDNSKGLIINSFGIYSDSIMSTIIERLKNKK